MYTEAAYRSKWIIFAVSAIEGFLAMMASNTVNIALYEIANDFKIDVSAAQWAVTVYILVFCTGSLF